MDKTLYTHKKDTHKKDTTIEDVKSKIEKNVKQLSWKKGKTPNPKDVFGIYIIYLDSTITITPH